MNKDKSIVLAISIITLAFSIFTLIVAIIC